MKRFNINDYMYVQITKDGWEHLSKTVGDEYVKHCVSARETVVNGETWYRLQCHEVFCLFPVGMARKLLFFTNVMIDDEALKEVQ